MRRPDWPISRPTGWRYWVRRLGRNVAFMVAPYGMLISVLFLVTGLPEAGLLS